MAIEFRIGGEERFLESFDRTFHAIQLPHEKSWKRLKRSSWQQRKLYSEVVDRDIAKFESTTRGEIKRFETTAKVVQVFSALITLAMPIFFSYLSAWFTLGAALPTLLLLGMIKGKIENTVDEKKRLYDAQLIMRGFLKEQSAHALRPIGEWDLPAIDPRLKSDLMMQEDLKKKHPQSAKHLNRLLSNVSSCDCPDHPRPDKPKMRHCLDLEASPTAMLNAARELAQFPDRKEVWESIKERVFEANGHLVRGELDLYEEKMAQVKLDALMIGGPFGDMGQQRAQAQLSALLASSAPSPQNQVRALVANFQYFNQIYQNELYPLYKEWNRFFETDFWLGRESFLKFAREIKDEVEKLVPLLIRGDEVSEKEWLEVLQVAKKERLQTRIDDLILQTRSLNVLLKREVENDPIEKYQRALEELDHQVLSAGAVNYLEGWIDKHPEEAKLPIGQLIDLDQKEKELLPKQIELDEWIGNHREDARKPIGDLVNQLDPEVGEWVNRNEWAKNLPLDTLLYEPQIRGWLRLDEDHQLLAQDSVIKIKERNRVMRFAYQEVAKQARGLQVLSVGAVNYLEGWIDKHPEEAKLPIGQVMHLDQKEKELLPRQIELDEWILNHREDARKPIGDLVNQLDPEVGEWVNRNEWAKNLPLDTLLYEPQIRGWLRLDEDHQLLAQDSVIKIKERNRVKRDALAAFTREFVSLKKLINGCGETSRAGLVWKRLWHQLPVHRFDPIRIPKNSGWAKAKKIKELFVKRKLKAIDAKMVYLNRVRHYGFQAIAGLVICVVQAIFRSNPYVFWSLSAAGLLIQAIFIYLGDYITEIDEQKQGIKLQVILQDEPQLKRLLGSRPALHALKEIENSYNLDGLELTWARISTEKEEKVLSDPWRVIAKKAIEEARPALDRELDALLTLRYKKKAETLLNLLEKEDKTLVNLLAVANLTRKVPWTEEEISNCIETRIEEIRRGLYYIRYTPQEKVPRTHNRLFKKANHAAQIRRKREMDLEQVASQRRKVERLTIYSYVQRKIVEAFEQGDHKRLADEDLGVVVGEIGKIVRKIYKEGGNSEDVALLKEECEKLKYFPLDRLNEHQGNLDKIRRKMEAWDQKFVQESLLFERALERVKKWKEEVARERPSLERTYRIFDYLKNQLDQACLEGGERNGGKEDLCVLITSISQLAERLDRGDEEASEEGLVTLCEELKLYPQEQLQSWAAWFKNALLEKSQRIQEQVKKQLQAVALELRLPNFKIDESRSYQELFEKEEEHKERLARARLNERKKKIRFALEVQVMKDDQEIVKKRMALHKYVRRQIPQIKEQLAPIIERVNRSVKHLKDGLNTALVHARDNEAIAQALQTFREGLQEVANRQVDKRLQVRIRSLVEGEEKVAVSIKTKENLIPELKELIYNERF